MISSVNFNAFVVGLNAWLIDESDITLFRWGCHQLAFAMPQTYPRTHKGLLKLLEKPLENWYPSEIPEKFDARHGLLDSGQLTEEAEHYVRTLRAEDLPKGISDKRAALEDELFRQLFEKLSEAHKKGDKRAQAEYVSLRRFLIEHPYATSAQLSQKFLRNRYTKPAAVGELYESILPDNDKRPLWKCERCGPLTKRHEHLKGIKPTVCNDHTEEMDSVEKVPWQPNLRQLKRGIHLSVCLPGIPEVFLFQRLEELRDRTSPGLQKVELYPEMDSYDLQLCFSDGTVWAVDVKDYPDPSNLTNDPTPLKSKGSLRYDEGLYVVPQVYLDRTEDYLSLARSQADMQKMQLMGSDAFESKVKGKIKQLKREKK